MSNIELAHKLEGDLYHELCQVNSVGSRLLGIIETDTAIEAIEDPDTLTVETARGPIPAIVPIEYADGYDVARCRDIVQEDNDKVWYYALPPHTATSDSLTKLAKELETKTQGGYIFYDYEANTQGLLDLENALDKTSLVYEEIPLQDEMAAAGNEQASISLYGFDFPAENQETNSKGGAKEMYAQYKKGVAEGKYRHDLKNGSVLLLGTEIDESLLEDMWSLYKDRFQWLGEKHPVSMEDTKEAFTSVLLSPGTLSSVRFEEGKPACFVYLTEGIDLISWLNKDFLYDSQKVHMDEDQTLLFFPGIVSNEKGAGYSMGVVGLLANTAFDANVSLKVIFENTNRSEVYIPKLLTSIINRIGRVAIELPELLDRTVYGCVKFDKPKVA